MSRKKLLLVDDSKTILLQEEVILKRSYDLVTASNGREGVERARAEKPDLIVMDVVMPEMDGLEACRALRADPQTRALPILLVTSRGEPQSRAAGFESGCSDYLTKPINPIDLLARISENLETPPSSSIPPVEVARARVLRQYQILDTPGEDTFDGLAHLAAQIADCPMAAITFVDRQRIWVKAIAGASRGDEIARERFPCDRVVQSSAALFIEDMMTEPLLKDHAFLRQHRIRAYAGLPLIPPGELAVGALAVFDTRARAFPRLEQEALETVSRQVITQMDARRSAIRDPVTGAFNRGYMDETLERELRRADRLQAALGLSLIEVPRLENAVLGELGSLLQSRTRQDDVVCRFEANVFAVILPTASIENARRRTEQLQEAVRTLGVKAAAGTASFPESGRDTASLVRAARAALKG